MADLPIVPHLRSTDLIQPLREHQPETVHFNGTFPAMRRFKSNPDLASLKVIERNRFDRIPSPPVCGLDVSALHRKLERINPARITGKTEKTRLYVRPSSMEWGSCNRNDTATKRKTVQDSEIEEIGQMCKKFADQVTLLK